jgi:hypothetical protein
MNWPMVMDYLHAALRGKLQTHPTARLRGHSPRLMAQSRLSGHEGDAGVELAADVVGVAADPQALRDHIQVLAAHPTVLVGFQDSARPVVGPIAPIAGRLTAPGPAESRPWGCLPPAVWRY